MYLLVLLVIACFAYSYLHVLVHISRHYKQKAKEQWFHCHLAYPDMRHAKAFPSFLVPLLDRVFQIDLIMYRVKFEDAFHVLDFNVYAIDDDDIIKTLKESSVEHQSLSNNDYTTIVDVPFYDRISSPARSSIVRYLCEQRDRVTFYPSYFGTENAATFVIVRYLVNVNAKVNTVRDVFLLFNNEKVVFPQTIAAGKRRVYNATLDDIDVTEFMREISASNDMTQTKLKVALALEYPDMIGSTLVVEYI